MLNGKLAAPVLETVKEAELPLLQIAKALVSLGLIVADHAHQEHAVHDAEEHQQAERDLSAEEMRSTIDNLKPKQACAEMLAIQSGRLMAKTAMGVPWASMGAAAKNIGGAVSSAAKAITPGWKTKAVMGAGILGAGYAGYKGMQAAKDYMSTPVHDTQRWGSSRPAMNNVSEYGYPTL